MSQQLPLFITMPHSGEVVPEICDWLFGLPEDILMCDVDRYIDILYEPALNQLHIPFEKTKWHRYAVDLNRNPTDIDRTSVLGDQNPPGLHNRGFHWVVTTQGNQLMKKPMTLAYHRALCELVYDPFHQGVQKHIESFKNQGINRVFHLDVHSMPSVGTSMHKDPGERRADIVISDSLGMSCDSEFRDLVIAAYVTAGFRVGYNWPYVGGRLTERYGQPHLGQNTIQVELNRGLYMNEVTKKINSDVRDVQIKIEKALMKIQIDLKTMLAR